MGPLSVPWKKVVASSTSMGKETSGSTNGFLAAGVVGTASCPSISESCGGLRISVLWVRVACLLYGMLAAA
jgi:hypothetical protein